MLRNPIHKRLEKLANWQQVTFMACLCERMAPNYQVFCQQTGFGEGGFYRRILDLVWETLLVKEAKVNFENQLEKLESEIPDSEQYDIYGVHPAVDACAALGALLHALLSGDTLEYAITISKNSINTVAMLEMTQRGEELEEEQLKALPAIQDELDIQWEIYRLLSACSERDLELIKGLRTDIREASVSNIGIKIEQ